jgi:hypothetical protein
VLDLVLIWNYIIDVRFSGVAVEMSMFRCKAAELLMSRCEVDELSVFRCDIDGRR